MRLSANKRRMPRRNLLHQEAVEVSSKKFVDLPFDVVIEVVRYLEPLDLLHLARTTKGHRASILDRQRVRHIWRTTISNVHGLPPCPDYISEPAYTHLAFEPVCHGCFNPCNTIEWELRMRCCPACLPKMTMRLPTRSRDKVVQKTCSVRLPASVTHLEYRGRELNVESVELTPRHRISDWNTSFNRAKQSKTTTEKFVDKENKKWEPIIKHAALCREWEYERSREQAPRLRLVQDKRVEDIKEHLKVMGWEDDIYYSERFLDLPAVTKPEPLTQSVWSQISPKIVASLPKVRLARMAEIYHIRLELFRSVYAGIGGPGLKACPRPIDIFLHPDVRDVIESDLNTEMNNNTMSEKLLPILRRAMQEWCDDAVNKLTSFGQQQLGPGCNVEPGNLVFRCTRCLEIKDSRFPMHMRFDVALSHEHLYPQFDTATKRKPAYSRMKKSKIYEEIGKEVYESDFRSLGALRVDKDTTQEVDTMVKALGGTVYILPVYPQFG